MTCAVTAGTGRKRTRKDIKQGQKTPAEYAQAFLLLQILNDYIRIIMKKPIEPYFAIFHIKTITFSYFYRLKQTNM